MTEEHKKRAAIGLWVGIGVNLGLTVLKGVAGMTTHSKALLADALHSASDTAGAIAGIRGHRAGGPIVSILLSVLATVIGVEIVIATVKSLSQEAPQAPDRLAFVIIALSIVIKEAMFQYQYRVGKKIGSQAVIARAWEHRSDIYSSIVAFIGIGGAMLGHYIGMPLLYYLDPIAGLLIAVLVMRLAYRYMMEAVQHSTDRVLRQEDSRELFDTVQRVKGVISIDDLQAKEHGHYVIVDMKISVNPRITILEGHEIAKTVKQTLMKRFIHVSDVCVQVNPYDPGYPYKSTDAGHDDMPTLLH
ncbi:cation diffusion facilitator family transporter [Paenibacillus validus]|uniref:cation diffusion facilitator family transporter n=1 Tax=Paenibacillus TaxID=44249 RepID=UPI000FD8DB00|nr:MULTISPECIES: cation diffusion facilitator family transporter [Paenibacillus]MED4603062.1 cation diffusion facilitator family transporter [Paenibacillus validus]MED4608602.1 cation diffusion facilitator family transporter [Paenibacillus validus]